MTQMMLFDTSSSLATTPTTGVLQPSVLTPRKSKPGVLPSAKQVGEAISAAASEPDGRKIQMEARPDGDGVHRMGDLARLVLLRYELLARRREEMAKRLATR